MSLADKLNYLGDTKGLIKDAIVNKGVDVSDTDTFRSYADKIKEIQVGADPIVNMRLSNGVSDSEIVDGHKVIAVKTGEIPTEAGLITKSPDFTLEKGNSSYVRTLIFNNAKYKVIDGSRVNPSPCCFYSLIGDSFKLVKVLDNTSMPIDMDSYYTANTALPLLFCRSVDYNYFSDGTYQDKEGNFDKITLDVEPDAIEGVTSYICMTCSHDGKYLYAWRYSNSALSTSFSHKLYIYSVTFTNKIEASYIASCEIETNVNTIGYVLPSVNDYSVAVRPYGGYYYVKIVTFDEETQTFEVKNALSEAGNNTYPRYLTKNWFVDGKNYLYWLDENKVVTQKSSSTIPDDDYTTIVSSLLTSDGVIWSGDSTYGNSLLKCPINNPTPETSDFGPLRARGKYFDFAVNDKIFSRRTWGTFFIYDYDNDTYGTYENTYLGDSIQYITSEGNILGTLYNYGTTTKYLIAPVNGIYDGSVKEQQSVDTTMDGLGGQCSPMLNGLAEYWTNTSGTFNGNVFKGLTYQHKSGGTNWSAPYGIFENVIIRGSNYMTFSDDGTLSSVQSLSTSVVASFYINGEYYGLGWKSGSSSNGNVYKLSSNGVLGTSELLYTDTSLKANYGAVGDGGATKDCKYFIQLGQGIYFDYTVDETGVPRFAKKDLPQAIKDVMQQSSGKLIQFFYDNRFGVSLENGYYYLFKYTDSLEDVEIEQVIPPEFENPENYVFVYSGNRAYWMIRYGNITKVGKSETLPVNVLWKAYPNTETWYNGLATTGFLTGEKVSDDGQGNRVVKVRAILK